MHLKVPLRVRVHRRRVPGLSYTDHKPRPNCRSLSKDDTSPALSVFYRGTAASRTVRGASRAPFQKYATAYTATPDGHATTEPRRCAVPSQMITATNHGTNKPTDDAPRNDPRIRRSKPMSRPKKYTWYEKTVRRTTRPAEQT